jgi:transposase
LRDRVIEAVERGKMSRREAGRHYEVSKSAAIKWLERLERYGSREPVGHGDHRPSKLMPHRQFLEAAGREIGHHASGSVRSPFCRARGQSRHLDEESFFRKIGVTFKKTLVAREQDRPDISRHRARWRAYQGLIDPRRLIFIDETWTKTNMTRLRGWAPEGERLRRQGPARQVEDRDVPWRSSQRSD